MSAKWTPPPTHFDEIRMRAILNDDLERITKDTHALWLVDREAAEKLLAVFILRLEEHLGRLKGK